MSELDHKSILITGCSSGIGECAAHTLRERGYRVFATARRPEDVERLRNDDFDAVQLDLKDSVSIKDAVETVLEKTGGTLYALFNNAGYGLCAALEDVSRDALRAQFETNLFGLHELTTHVIPVMRTQGYGRIIQNSSVLGFVALAYRGPYNASKFALEGLTDTLRLELRGSGIHCSIIQPGPILSSFRANALRAYQHAIDPELSIHKDMYRKMEQRLAKEGAAVPFTLGPDAVVKKLIHALESPRPKIRYRVTLPTYLFAGLKRLLTERLMDRVLGKTSGEGGR